MVLGYLEACREDGQKTASEEEGFFVKKKGRDSRKEKLPGKSCWVEKEQTCLFP